MEPRQMLIADDQKSGARQHDMRFERQYRNDFQIYKDYDFMSRNSLSLSRNGSQTSTKTDTKYRAQLVGRNNSNDPHRTAKYKVSLDNFTWDEKNLFEIWTDYDVCREPRKVISQQGFQYYTPVPCMPNQCYPSINSQVKISSQRHTRCESNPLPVCHQRLQSASKSELRLKRQFSQTETFSGSETMPPSEYSLETNPYRSDRIYYKEQRGQTNEKILRNSSHSRFQTTTQSGCPVDTYTGDMSHSQPYQPCDSTLGGRHNTVTTEQGVPHCQGYPSVGSKFCDIESWVRRQNTYLDTGIHYDYPIIYNKSGESDIKNYRSITKKCEQEKNDKYLVKNPTICDKNSGSFALTSFPGECPGKRRQYSDDDIISSVSTSDKDQCNSIDHSGQVDTMGTKQLKQLKQKLLSNRIEKNKITPQSTGSHKISVTRNSHQRQISRTSAIVDDGMVVTDSDLAKESRHLSHINNTLQSQNEAELSIKVKYDSEIHRKLTTSKETTNTMESKVKNDNNTEEINSCGLGNESVINGAPADIADYDNTDNESVHSCKSSIVYRKAQGNVSKGNSVDQENKCHENSKKRKSGEIDHMSSERKKRKMDRKVEKKSDGSRNLNKEERCNVLASRSNNTKQSSNCDEKEVKIKVTKTRQNDHNRTVGEKHLNVKMKEKCKYNKTSTSSARTDKHQVLPKRKIRTKCKNEMKSKLLNFDEEVMKLKRKSSKLLTRGMKEEIKRKRQEQIESTRQRLSMEKNILKMHSETSDTLITEHGSFEVLNALNDRAIDTEESDLEQLISSSLEWSKSVTSHSGGIWKRIVPENR